MMAATPLPAFQTEALRFAWLPVSARFCGLIADQLGAHRAAVTAMLTDPNDGTRAAAAIVLGMNPSPDQLPALERMWNTERQPLVRLAVAYSLACHGRRERVRTLVTALDHCTREVCLQAASLLEWLPRGDAYLRVVKRPVPRRVREPPRRHAGRAGHKSTPQRLLRSLTQKIWRDLVLRTVDQRAARGRDRDGTRPGAIAIRDACVVERDARGNTEPPFTPLGGKCQVDAVR